MRDQSQVHALGIHSLRRDFPRGQFDGARIHAHPAQRVGGGHRKAFPPQPHFDRVLRQRLRAAIAIKPRCLPRQVEPRQEQRRLEALACLHQPRRLFNLRIALRRRQGIGVSIG